VKLVALKIEGRLTVHGPAAISDYATLCGCDGNDPTLEIEPAKVPRGAKIDCTACRSIWAVARTLTARDFAR
jgi:hypothetical protein